MPSRRRIDFQRSYVRITGNDPDNVRAHGKLGMLYLAMDRPRASEASLRRAVRIDPDNADSYRLFAKLMESTEKFWEAASLLRQVTRIEGEDAQRSCKTALLLSKAGRYEEAEKEYRRAIALNADLQQARRGLREILNAKESRKTGEPGEETQSSPSTGKTEESLLPASRATVE